MDIPNKRTNGALHGNGFKLIFKKTNYLPVQEGTEGMMVIYFSAFPSEIERTLNTDGRSLDE